MNTLDLLKEISAKLDRQTDLLEQLVAHLKLPRVEIQILGIAEDEAVQLAGKIKKSATRTPQ